MKFVEREIIFHGNHFIDFYLEQSTTVQEKIEFVFRIIRQVERVSKKFLILLDGTEGIYEIRVEQSTNIYRIFCCFEKGNIVVLFNAFQKKTQKTPLKEIEKAVRLKKEYLEQIKRRI